MLALDSHQRFIYRDVTILAWGASVQRAKLYNPALPRKDRDSDKFRTDVLTFIETSLLPKYEPA